MSNHTEKLPNRVKARLIAAGDSDALEQWLTKQLRDSHNMTTSEISTLTSLVRRYLLLSEECLDVFTEMASDAQIYEYTQPFLNAACIFFDQPIGTKNPPDPGLILSQTYLFHRMLEELNDQISVHRRLPLVPDYITHTNILIHTLIGDKAANQLDQSVLIQLELINSRIKSEVSRIFNSSAARKATKRQQQEGWAKVLERWPFLKGELVDFSDLQLKLSR